MSIAVQVCIKYSICQCNECLVWDVYNLCIFINKEKMIDNVSMSMVIATIINGIKQCQCSFLI